MDKEKRKSGRRPPGEGPRGAPADLTQADVDGLIAGTRAVRVAWARRLRASVPSSPQVAAPAGTQKAAPLRVTRREMAQIAEGLVPDAVHRRLAWRTRRARPVAELACGRKETPDREPPDTSRQR